MTVRLDNNIVAEIIPNYALPVEKWYGKEFTSQCVQAPDVVKTGWVFNPDTGVFSEPPILPPKPTTEQKVDALQEENAQLRSQLAQMDSAMSELLLNVIPSLLPQ